MILHVFREIDFREKGKKLAKSQKLISWKLIRLKNYSSRKLEHSIKSDLNGANN